MVQVFPSERSLERLVGAVMCELDEQWSESRYFAYGKIQELYDEKRKKGPEGAGRPAADLALNETKLLKLALQRSQYQTARKTSDRRQHLFSPLPRFTMTLSSIVPICFDRYAYILR